MKTAKENNGAGGVDVDALLAAINEISESEVQRELAEAFELDIHDFSVTEANR